MAEESGIDFQQEQDMFLFSTALRPPLRLTKPLIQWVRALFPPGVKQPGH